MKRIINLDVNAIPVAKTIYNNALLIDYLRKTRGLTRQRWQPERLLHKSGDTGAENHFTATQPDHRALHCRMSGAALASRLARELT